VREGGGVVQAFGRGLVRAAPLLMKALAVLGTAAMFLVGGGILVHGIPALHHLVPEGWAIVGDLVVGVVTGAVVLAVVTAVQTLRARLKG
jgi:predicted DNA repair protein MutK